MTPEKRERHNRWLIEHPLWSWAITLWIVMAVLVAAMGAKACLDALARWVAQ